MLQLNVNHVYIPWFIGGGIKLEPIGFAFMLVYGIVIFIQVFGKSFTPLHNTLLQRLQTNTIPHHTKQHHTTPHHTTPHHTTPQHTTPHHTTSHHTTPHHTQHHSGMLSHRTSTFLHMMASTSLQSTTTASREQQRTERVLKLSRQMSKFAGHEDTLVSNCYCYIIMYCQYFISFYKLHVLSLFILPLSNFFLPCFYCLLSFVTVPTFDWICSIDCKNYYYH